MFNVHAIHIYLFVHTHYTFSHIDIHHRAIYKKNDNTTNLFWFDFWYSLNWFMHEMNRKRKKQDAHHYFHVWLKWRSSNISAAKWNQTFSMLPSFMLKWQKRIGIPINHITFIENKYRAVHQVTCYTQIPRHKTYHGIAMLFLLLWEKHK